MLLVKHSAESDDTFSRKREAFCTLHGLSQSNDHDRVMISSFVGSHSSVVVRLPITLTCRVKLLKPSRVRDVCTLGPRESGCT